MNWVGGARSRVKYFNNNKVQRDYFECKRLAAKVQRLEPSRKKNGSQDLYFFSKTLTGELKPGSTTQHSKPVAKPTKLTKLEARKDFPHMSNLELPMSPIGQPSVLDITSILADDQELSFYGLEPVKEQPRMSTHKLPHLINRESLGDHTMSDIKDVTADESLLSLGLDFSATSESIFPPPRKKLKPELSAPANPYSKCKQPTTTLKNHSGGKAHNASCFNKPLVPAAAFKPPTIVTEVHKPGRDAAHQKPGLMKRKKYDSKATTFRKPEKRMSRIYDQAPYHQHNTTSHGGEQRRKSVVAYNQDAMLEFHYEEQGHSSKDERKRRNKCQRVPETAAANEHFRIDFGGIESSVVPSLSEQASLPVVSASNVTVTQSAWSSDTITKHPCSVSSTGLSKNPFLKRPVVDHKPHTCNRKEVASHTDLDESILHPIVEQAKHKEVASHAQLSESILNPIRGPKIQQQDVEVPQDQHDTTLFDESIFGPIQKKRDKAGGSEMGAVLCQMVAYQQTSKKTSKPNAFELMMKSFERDKHRCKGRDVDCDKGKDYLREKQLATGVEGSELVLKNLEWKNFVNGVKDIKPIDREGQADKSYCQQEVQDSEQTQRMCVINPKMSFGNISVLEELICLEEENAADLISQDFPISPADWTEDPIFIRAPQEGQRRVHRPACGFDSSQESMETTRGSSWNSSSSNSVSRYTCNPTLNSEATVTSDHTAPSHSVGDHWEEEDCSRSLVEEITAVGEKVHHASRGEEAVKGEHEQLSVSQTIADERTQNTKIDDINNITGDSQARSNSQATTLKTKDGACQAMENFTADNSTQWSPRVTQLTSMKHSPVTETQRSASQCVCHKDVSAKAAGIQTKSVASDSHQNLILSHDSLSKPRLTGRLTERTSQIDRSGHHARAIDKLKKDVARLERELGMAQSTLVWQSLMMRLQQV